MIDLPFTLTQDELDGITECMRAAARNGKIGTGYPFYDEAATDPRCTMGHASVALCGLGKIEHPELDGGGDPSEPYITWLMTTWARDNGIEGTQHPGIGGITKTAPFWDVANPNDRGDIAEARRAMTRFLRNFVVDPS